jgi:hypothetical protein
MSGLVDSFTGTASAIALLVAIVAATWTILTDFGRSFIFLRRIHAGQTTGRTRDVLWTIFSVAWDAGVWWQLKKGPLFDNVRIRTEHELFSPRPIFHWPPVSGSDEYASFISKEQQFKKGGASSKHKENYKKWRKSMRKIYDGGPDSFTIFVDTPAEINEKFVDIKRYFDTLKTVSVKRGENIKRFKCLIEINNGFISPIHLLTGLLVHFDSNWEKIIKAFNRDVKGDQSERIGKDVLDLRQIQMFIYNCWLLWGPSIPLCGCPLWRSEYKVVQYGFGDENNSIEVVGERTTIEGYLANLAEPYAGSDLRPMALPANVRGLLRLSGSISSSEKKDVNGLPPAARNSWTGDLDERPLLYVTENNPAKPTADDGGEVVKAIGKISGAVDQNYESKYYSAYLWMAFGLITRDGDNWRTARVVDGVPAKDAWRNLVPFFEHGNLADPESCAFGKKQLAAKVLNAIVGVARDWGPGREDSVKFAYACAIDDSGCSHPIAHKDWTGSASLRDLLQQALDDAAEIHGVGSIYDIIKTKGIIDFEHYTPADGRHEYSACQLPTYVARHYESMAA